jgi:hypothetical protein
MGSLGVRCAFARVLYYPGPEIAVIGRQPIRVLTLLTAMALMGHLGGAELQAQVGVSSALAEVSLAVRAPLRAGVPRVSAPRVIGRRGDLSEAAVSLDLPVNSRYRLVASRNVGSNSRVWLHVGDEDYEELIPGRAITLPPERRASSEREVRYVIEGSTSSAELPLRFDLVIDPVI